jgi:hypothetical protein
MDLRSSVIIRICELKHTKSASVSSLTIENDGFILQCQMYHTKATFLLVDILTETADTVFLVGARLNWMLHFGQPPRWNHKVNIIQVNNTAEKVYI